MVTVQVRQKNTGELREADMGGTQDLLLRPLATVNEPPLASLRQV
jgi:hypothetical protein